MKNKIMILVGAAALFALAQTTQAVPITGAIGFTGNANLNTGTASTATTVVSWSGSTTANPTVTSDSGTLASLISPGTQIVFNAPWNFTVSAPIIPFWSVLGTPGINFQLSSSTYSRGTIGANPYVAISGTGLLNAPGYDATVWSFSVTFQDPATVPANQTFTFSASQNSVPDGGTTVMLLGAALSGMALIKRKFIA